MLTLFSYFFPLTKTLVQLQIEDASRRLRSGDLGIPANPEERFEALGGDTALVELLLSQPQLHEIIIISKRYTINQQLLFL